ncbi:MAG: FGGY family carbohydrate kinase [Clostridia bacterium]|nr:FGGY family carbohydrate kinase [Clostridia bacterium]
MYILGIDVGTTGTKALLIDEKGNVVAGGYKEYKLISDGVRVTQNAADWWDAAVFAVRRATEAADKTKIAALSLSTQAASMFPCDGDGEPLGEVITWMDSRSAAQTKVLTDAVGSESIYRKSGWLPNPALDASKIMWLRENEPELFSRADKFISTIEYLNIKLCGRCAIDPTNAAMRQMFNLETCDWDREILSAVGIGREKLPEILPIGAPVGTLTPEAANALGLPEAVTVYNGAHDQYCAAIGCGAVNSGDMLLATGTTWVVLGVTDGLLYTENHICPGIHPVSGKYGALASLVSAGSALNWYKSIIDGDFKVMDAEAEKRRESAKNLFALPYLCGAGFPHNRPDMRGAMFGLDVGHDKYHIALAMMEGVAFEADTVLRQFAENKMNINKLMMTGGAARSRVWSEIVGYVTGCEIYRMKEPETCCMGAAMIAAVGAGLFPDYTACRTAMVKSEKLELSDASAFDFYREKGQKYRALAEKVKSISL